MADKQTPPHKFFLQSQIEAIAKALADTEEGLTGTEIDYLLVSLKIANVSPGTTKWKRLHDAFVGWQNKNGSRTGILEFIRQAMKPERYAKNPGRFELIRVNLNRAILLFGLVVDASGILSSTETAANLSEASQRADELRSDLGKRGVHPDVLRFCKAELVEDNYFHAVLEAAKSVADKLRTKSGLSEDGGKLVDLALCGLNPRLAINPLATESHRSEQNGFANLVKGTFGMFRNPTAHEAKILWAMTKEDAEDLLSLASLIHRRLDTAKII